MSGKNGSKPTYLKKADIESADDLIVVDVDVPEWGGVVRVRALSADDELQVVKRMVKRRNGDVVLRADGVTPEVDFDGALQRQIMLAGMAIIDENGERMFGDDEIGSLASKSKKALDRITAVVEELSGGNVAELTENLEPTVSGGSGSA